MVTHCMSWICVLCASLFALCVFAQDLGRGGAGLPSEGMEKIKKEMTALTGEAARDMEAEKAALQKSEVGRRKSGEQKVKDAVEDSSEDSRGRRQRKRKVSKQPQKEVAWNVSACM